jgi:hypothetical protein
MISPRASWIAELGTSAKLERRSCHITPPDHDQYMAAIRGQADRVNASKVQTSADAQWQLASYADRSTVAPPSAPECDPLQCEAPAVATLRKCARRPNSACKIRHGLQSHQTDSGLRPARNRLPSFQLSYECGRIRDPHNAVCYRL